jgi:exodeoxyribonuclease VII large subunit
MYSGDFEQMGVMSPSEFVESLNMAIELTIPIVAVEGELQSFRISKGVWVYFELIDDNSSVKCFGSVRELPGPLKDGMRLKVIASPKLHAKYGFSLNFISLSVVGEGSINQAKLILFKKLEAEGLFASDVKRLVPTIPKRIALITSFGSAAYYDFVKTINDRLLEADVDVIDCLVQGPSAAGQIVSAIERINSTKLYDVLVLTRGGGSLEDLSVFNDERVVRAVANSKATTIVAVGHEIDVCLAEMTADVRASTPTAAAMCLGQEKSMLLQSQTAMYQQILGRISELFSELADQLSDDKRRLVESVGLLYSVKKEYLAQTSKYLNIVNPQTLLKRGYAIVYDENKKVIKSIPALKAAESISIQLYDGIHHIKESRV